MRDWNGSHLGHHVKRDTEKIKIKTCHGSRKCWRNVCAIGQEEKRSLFFFPFFLFFRFYFISFYFILRSQGGWWGGRWGESKDMRLYRTPVLSFSAAHGCCVYTHTSTHTHTYMCTCMCVLYICAWPGHDDFQGAQGAPLWGPSPPQRETGRRNMAAIKWSSPAVSVDFGTDRPARMRCLKKKEKK